MRLIFFFLLVVLLYPMTSKAQNCPNTPVLSRLQLHTSLAGETVASLAQTYNLSPQTIIKFNPNLNTQVLLPGTVVVIPPLNGMSIQAPPGATWQDLSSAYGIRADVLFELNGCQKKPNVVFIPGIFTNTSTPAKKSNYTGLSGYPLPQVAKVGLSYGWQQKVAANKEVSSFFHSGIDLLAPLNTPVLAAENGTIVVAGIEGSYGNLVIITHNGGLQTRYAHLNTITVAVGAQVKAGQVIGTVGRTGEPDLTVPHLHFEVRLKRAVGWVSQDPLLHLTITTPSSTPKPVNSSPPTPSK